MIIDAHAHGFHSKDLDRLINVGGQWLKERVDSLMKIKPQLFDVPLRLEWLKNCGVDKQVICTQQTLDCNLLPRGIDSQLDMARVINDGMAHLMEDSKGKLLPAASIPLVGFEKSGRKEMERAIKTLGLKAISLPSNLQGKPLDLPEFEPFWALAEQLDVPVYIHPNDAAGSKDRSYEAEYDLMHNFGWPFETMLTLSRLVFSEIMERYRNLKIVCHHLGGGIPFLWGRINETYNPSQQMRTIGKILPRPLYDYFSLFYYDTAVGGSSSAIKCTYETFGASHIVFATDAPWGPGTGEFRLSEYQKAIKSLNLPEDDNRKIFSGNAVKILKLT
jgi:aminocarboxymuconate-semialdehyde decarboxylase